MGRLLIIGCGGVAGVAIHKCCQNSKTFSEICIASRTKAKCDALKEKLEGTTDTKITTAQVDYRCCCSNVFRFIMYNINRLTCSKNLFCDF